ncbi:hypothetical protein HHX47_DHR4000438 [Lentinula edodes]|nr:hypothetical protein HHX47_DHR4000438 [Lentinula edodes]
MITKGFPLYDPLIIDSTRTPAQPELEPFFSAYIQTSVSAIISRRAASNGNSIGTDDREHHRPSRRLQSNSNDPIKYFGTPKNISLEGWIVIYIPRAKATVNSTTTHMYDLRTETYLQPNYAEQTLRRIELNSANSETLTLQEGLNYDRRSFSSGTTLAQLASAGSKDAVISSVVLETLLNELSRQSKIPVLLAIDDFQAIYNQKTAYRDPHFSAIRPYHFAILHFILEFASGKWSFPKGAVLGPLTAMDPAFPATNEPMDELGLPGLHPRSPYSR